MNKASAPSPQFIGQLPPAYNCVRNSQNQRWTRIKQLTDEYAISKHWADQLQLLAPYRIILVLDDSGTMLNLMDKSPLNDGDYRVTRWEELSHFSKICVDIANVFNHGGTEVYFLNQKISDNRMSLEQLSSHLNYRPSGNSLITKTLNKVVKDITGDYRQVKHENKYLILLVTDGEPTDEDGSPDINNFRQCVKSLPPNVLISIVCFGDKSKYIKKMSKVPRLHIHGDFYEEQTISKANNHTEFSYGDYVAKYMLAIVGRAAVKVERKSFWSFLSC